jgi:anti-sigma factor RsiW
MTMSDSEHIAADVLNALIEGELSDEESERVETHIDSCEQCFDALEAVSADGNPLAVLPHEAAPPSFLPRVEGRIRRRSRGRFFSAGWQTNRWVSYLGAAIVVVILTALYFFSQFAFDVRDLPGDAPHEEQEGPQDP